VIFGDIVAFHVRLKTWTATGQLARFLGSNTAFGTGKITRRKGPRHVLTLLSEMVASLQRDPWTTRSGSGHWRASRLESIVWRQTSEPCISNASYKASLLHVSLLDRRGDQGMFRSSVLLNQAFAEVLPHRVALRWQ
jgi:hypothetical protein